MKILFDTDFGRVGNDVANGPRRFPEYIITKMPTKTAAFDLGWWLGIDAFSRQLDKDGVWHEAEEIPEPPEVEDLERPTSSPGADGQAAGLPLRTVGPLEVYDARDFPGVQSRVVIRDCDVEIRPDRPFPVRVYVDPEAQRIVALHIQLDGMQLRPKP